MLLGGIGLHTFVTLAYRAPQTVEYLIPAYVLMAIVMGYGLGRIGVRNRNARRLVSRITYYVLRVACCVAIVMLFVNHFPSFQWLRAEEDTRAYTQDLLNAAPPNAILLSNWHWANPMWYLQQVEGLRPDVEVQYVYPRGETLAQSWLNAIEAGLRLAARRRGYVLPRSVQCQPVLLHAAFDQCVASVRRRVRCAADFVCPARHQFRG